MPYPSEIHTPQLDRQRSDFIFNLQSANGISSCAVFPILGTLRLRTVHKFPDKRRISPAVNVRTTGGFFLSALRRAPNTFARSERGEADHPATRKREKKPRFTKGRHGIAEGKIRTQKNKVPVRRLNAGGHMQGCIQKNAIFVQCPVWPLQKAGPLSGKKK